MENPGSLLPQSSHWDRVRPLRIQCSVWFYKKSYASQDDPSKRSQLKLIRSVEMVVQTYTILHFLHRGAILVELQWVVVLHCDIPHEFKGYMFICLLPSKYIKATCFGPNSHSKMYTCFSIYKTMTEKFRNLKWLKPNHAWTLDSIVMFSTWISGVFRHHSTIAGALYLQQDVCINLVPLQRYCHVQPGIRWNIQRILWSLMSFRTLLIKVNLNPHV